MTAKVHKASYTIPCSSVFRDTVENLAAQRSVNVGDLARSILLTVPYEVIRDAPDPGGPGEGDREERVLKSGPSEGRVWRRKPRLQLRMTPGYDPIIIRRALGLALSLDRGDYTLQVQKVDRQILDEQEAGRQAREVELERLKTVVSELSFDPLMAGIRTRGEALHVLGFPPTTRPDGETIQARYRALAAIHHPDNEFGDHQRMSQLNAAREILSRPYV